MSGDLLTAIFCSEREGLRRENVVKLCFQGSFCISTCSRPVFGVESV